MTLIFLPACRAMFGHTPRWSRIFKKCFLFFVDAVENEESRNDFVKGILYFSDLKSKGFP